MRLAASRASGSTAYLNLETGDCHGDDIALRALIGSGVSRVVIGMKHPLQHVRGKAIQVMIETSVRDTALLARTSTCLQSMSINDCMHVQELRRAGVVVEVLSEANFVGDPLMKLQTYQACLNVNEVSL